MAQTVKSERNTSDGGEISIKDFTSICRFCMKRNDALVPIFKGDDFIEGAERVDELIRICLGIEINADDGLPLFMCTKCFEHLLQCHNFRRKCRESNDILQKIRNQKEEMEESFCIETNFDDDSYKNDNGFVSGGSDGLDNMVTKELKIEIDTSRNEINKHKSGKREKFKNKTKSDNETAAAKRRKTRPEMCEICGTMQTNIKMHLRIHGNMIVFECDHCGRKFNQKSNIRTHFKVHLNDRPYHCTLCPFKFLQLAHLRRHMLTHTGEKPYKCDMCPKAFAQTNSLAEHRLIHTQDRQVPCPHCDKMFLTKKALKSHVGVHTGERPFKCELCGQSYVSSSGLSAHRRIHKRDNQTVTCDICQQVFETRKIWKNHMRDHGFRMR